MEKQGSGKGQSVGNWVGITILLQKQIWRERGIKSPRARIFQGWGWGKSRKRGGPGVHQVSMGEGLHFIFPQASLGEAGKESACSVGDLGSIPGLGRSTREGKG